MTLPTGQISMSQVRAEIGASGAIDLNHPRVRILARRGNPISMANLRGKTRPPIWFEIDVGHYSGTNQYWGYSSNPNTGAKYSSAALQCDFATVMGEYRADGSINTLLQINTVFAERAGMAVELWGENGARGVIRTSPAGVSRTVRLNGDIFGLRNRLGQRFRFGWTWIA